MDPSLPLVSQSLRRKSPLTENEFYAHHGCEWLLALKTVLRLGLRLLPRQPIFRPHGRLIAKSESL